MPSAFLSHRAGPAFSHSPCPAAAPRLGSGVSFGQGTRLGADSPSPGSGDAGRAPGLGDTERALHPSAGNTALLADRGEHAWLGKGKPRHITETGAPSLSLSLPPALRLRRRRRRPRGLRPSALAPRRGTPKPEGESPPALAFVPGAGARGAGARQRRGGPIAAPAPLPPRPHCRPRTCTRARRQQRAGLPCSSHSPWLKRPARPHRGRSRGPVLPAAGRRAWDSACRGAPGTG